MVDRLALCVGRVKHQRLVVEVRRKTLQRQRVGAVRTRGKGHAREVVEHHGAGAFKEQVVVFESAVVDHVLHAVVLLQELQHVAAPLAPPAGVEHGVDRHVAARVGGEPVVRNHRVRRLVPAVVVEQVHRHAGFAQGIGGAAHFVEGAARGFVGGAVGR
ncbi:hypothetical protein D9M69_540700 [compost metagenome]